MAYALADCAMAQYEYLAALDRATIARGNCCAGNTPSNSGQNRKLFSGPFVARRLQQFGRRSDVFCRFALFSEDRQCH